jgi:hypothetical protein
MKAGRGSSLPLLAEMVRKYQKQIVPAVETESTLVPLAGMHEFPRLSEHLTDGRGVNEQQKN